MSGVHLLHRYSLVQVRLKDCGVRACVGFQESEIRGSSSSSRGSGGSGASGPGVALSVDRSSRNPIASRKRSKAMGRTRTKSKLQRHIPSKPSVAQSSSTSSPSILALISKAQSIIEQCDYDLADQFLQRILQKSPENAEAREMLGVVQLETGLVREAREVSRPSHSPDSLFSKPVAHLDL